MIKKLFHYLKENSWKTVHFTNKTDEYGRIKGILNDNGIKTKTQSSTPYDSSQLEGFGTSYDILVKAKDFHKAQQVLSKERR